MSNDTDKKTPPGGRPKKADHERRLRLAATRMTIAEHEHLKKKATAAGMTVADYLRERALGPLPGPTAKNAPTEGGVSQVQLASLLRELNSVGVNLNQLVRSYHTGRQTVHDLKEVQEELSRVMAKVGEQFG